MERVEQTIEKNKAQKAFYNHKKKNLPTRIWSFIREKGLKDIRKELGILEQSYALHKQWLGPLEDKRVLDLGCYAGNALSLYLAQHAKAYVGIDLSDKGIGILKKKIQHIPTAKAHAVDFFSDSFQENDFDIIYAYGVLHHFKNVDALIERLEEKLTAGGIIISYDPLKTSLPVWVLRTLYRPFQSDAAWEFPFGRKTLRKLERAFTIKERRAVLGTAKWYFLVQLLPISKEKKQRWGRNAHQKDWERSATSSKHLLTCMQLNLLLQKK
ncbi:MAG TPA: class I SAM-dependent methyltransferase [Flavobacteriaceae bacterium]|nr:class I SAM-dependent methyltransferase [Alteromonas sp.]HPF12197.1 class I SAM-dependent methyltransferase [Flavobacteriaceae bacterium]HQU22330.1 class I SAM-dependent methyltransferase [Flavobacteriaceae bacterium]HQU66171.1 class I SAM-dependent methyltransferase [Flavobacteriaceae bacterium]HRW45854.1 class I SAM-dependent methyltransferase [Flavobacteriaceae bacterium]